MFCNQRSTRVTCCLIIVDVYPLQLKITVTLVAPGGVDAVLITYNFPELKKWDDTAILS